MKKLLAIVMVLAMVLSMSVVAWAEEVNGDSAFEGTTSVPSAERNGSSSDDLPGESEAVEGATITTPAADDGEDGAPAEEAKIIANEDLNEEQQAAVDTAMTAVKEEGYEPVDTLFVESESEAIVEIALEDGTVVFLVYPGGKIVKLTLAELNNVGNGRYEIPVDGTCVIVLAKEA